MAKTNTGAVGAAYSKEQLSRSYDAVIIESYGVGGLPSVEHKDFLKAVDKLIADYKKGKVR